MTNIQNIYAKYMWKCKYGDEYLFANDLFMANHTFSDIFDLKSVWVNNLLSFNFIVYFFKLLCRGFKLVLSKLFSQTLKGHSRGHNRGQIRERLKSSILKTHLSYFYSKREMETIDDIKESQPVSTHQLLRKVYYDWHKLNSSNLHGTEILPTGTAHPLENSNQTTFGNSMRESRDD